MGGLSLAGAALLAAGTLGIEWAYAPGFLQSAFVEIVLLGAGIILLFIALFSLLLDRIAPVPAPVRTYAGALSSPRASLMALPAIVGVESTASAPVSIPPPESDAGEFMPPTPTVVPGLAAESGSGSTLLIPFADESAGTAPAPPESTPGETVTRLVGRVETMQRLAPNGTTQAVAPASQRSGTLASSLLLRLTRVPTPPTAAMALTAARYCNDCGEALGSPPHFEPCGDCGRALCERCYWRTSTGPQAHLCVSCVQERSVPRPPVPALTFSGPGLAGSVGVPSGRLQARRRVN